MRTNLQVPFGEHYTAKRLGAKWDPVWKVWYCPDGTDLTPLLKWVPDMGSWGERIKKLNKEIKKRNNKYRKAKT